MPIRNWEKLTDFYEQVSITKILTYFKNKIKTDKSENGELINETELSVSDQQCTLIWEESKPLRIK